MNDPSHPPMLIGFFVFVCKESVVRSIERSKGNCTHHGKRNNETGEHGHCSVNTSGCLPAFQELLCGIDDHKEGWHINTHQNCNPSLQGIAANDVIHAPEDCSTNYKNQHNLLEFWCAWHLQKFTMFSCNLCFGVPSEIANQFYDTKNS